MRATATDNAPAFPYSPRMRNRLAIGLVACALLVGLLLAAWLAMQIVNRRQQPTFIAGPSVIVQIQSLSELVTVKYVIEKVIFAEAPKTSTLDNLPGLSGFRDDKIILLAQGIVKAGVDLSKLRPEDVEVKDGAIRITVPPAVVTDQYLDERATQVLDRKAGLLRAYDQKLEQQARQEALAQIVRAARVNGIEREANERARQQLETFLKSLGYREVEVRSASK